MRNASYYTEREAEDAMAVIAGWIGSNRDVKVVYHDGTAVDADIFKGIIRIPRMACASGVTEDALMLLRGRTYHEAGHIDETTIEKKEYPKAGALFDIWNALEDRRMEAAESKKHKGCEMVFRWNSEWHNKKIAEKMNDGEEAGPLWESMVAMSFMVDGLRPLWNLAPKAQHYVDKAYDEFMKIRGCKDAKESVDLAKVIYELLKDASKEWKKKQGEDEKKEQEKDDQQGEPQKGEGQQGEGQQGQGEGDQEGEPEHRMPQNDVDDEPEDSAGGSSDPDGEPGDEKDEDGEGSAGKGDDSDEDSEGSEKGDSGNGDGAEAGSGDGDSEDKSEGSDEGDSKGKSSSSKDGDEDGGEKGKDGGDEEGNGGKKGSQDDSEDAEDAPEPTRDADEGKGRGKKVEDDKEADKQAEKDLDEESNGMSKEDMQNEEIEDCFKEMDPADLKYISRRDNDSHSIPAISDNDKKTFMDRRERVSAMVVSMTMALEQALRSMARCRKKSYQRRGKIDRKRLVHIAKGISKEVFYKTRPGMSLDVAVAITIDESGSMGAWEEVQMLAIAIGEALHSIGVPFEILGSTTKYGYGCAPELDGFSRTNPIVYKHYKEFQDNWQVMKERIVHSSYHNHNIDGEVVEYAAFRLAQRKENRKVVFSLSDGEPCGGHGFENDRVLAKNLVRVCERSRKDGIEVYGFGIGTNDPEQFYGKDFFMYIEDVEEMAPDFVRRLAEIVTKGVVKL